MVRYVSSWTPRASTWRARPRSSSRVRASTSGPAGVDLGRGDERVGDVGAELRLGLLRRSAPSRRDSISARNSSSVSNSLAARASSSSSGGSTFSLISFTVDRDRLLRLVGELELDLLRLAGVHADDALLDLLDDGAAAELDDVVAPRLAVGRDEVDDDGVVRRDRPPLDGDELGDGRLERLELPLDELLGHLRPRTAPTSSFVQSASSGFAWTATVAVNCQSSSVRGGQLEVVLGLLDWADARLRGGVPEPAADVALDRLRHQPLAADALDEHLARHLALAEAGDLADLARSEAACSTAWWTSCDGTCTVEPDPVLGELLDFGLHPAIQAERHSASVA